MADDPPGKKYTLLVSTDLAPESWLPCGQDATFIGNGNQVTYGFPTSISAKSFWRIAVTETDSDEDGLTDAEENQLGTSPISTDSDNDGLSDAQEIALGTDPNKSDTDEDGLSDGDENQTGTDPKDPDSDDDGMIDGTDADPDEPLVSWAKAPEASYILIDVEGATNAVLPAGLAVRDLNDKGEVLFNDGVWACGAYTAKPFPSTVSRSVPSETEPLTYDVEFQTYERFNADGKIIGKARATFTNTPAAGGDPLDSAWSQPDADAPIHLADTVIANHDAVTGFYPMGIDHRGWTFSSESYYGTNYEARRRIVVATGQIPGGSASGEQYLEPPNGNLVAGMDGHFDVSRSGWLVTNTESQVDPENPNAAKTYQLVMWNPSLEEVTLPAGTDGLHFPVHLNELPNNKPALAATKSGDGGGSVYLQNQAGAMKRCASLSSQRIELFAGDGTALTSDNKLWRNGKLIPLRDLCPKVGEMLDAGWSLFPFKANKHGTYLIQAESPNGDVEVKLAVPTDLKAAVDNKEISVDKEDGEGAWAVLNFDDDDNDSGSWGHGETALKGDLDDTDGVSGENDMLRLGMHGVSISGARFRLKFDSSHIRVWKSEFKRAEEAVISEQTDFDGSGEGWTVYYIEGILPHDDDQGTIVTLQVKTGGGNWKNGDSVKIRVAHPVIAVFETNPDWNDTYEHFQEFAVEMAGPDPTRARFSLRSNASAPDTFLSKGKLYKAAGTPPEDVCYSISSIRGERGQQILKLALALENANVAMIGHANFGLGLAFDGPYTEFSQFFNSASGGKPAINLTHGFPAHPALNVEGSLFVNLAAADKINAKRVAGAANRFLQGIPRTDVVRYPNAETPMVEPGQTFQDHVYEVTHVGSNGQVLGTRNLHWHYPPIPGLEGDGAYEKRVILDIPSVDVPTLKYRALYINQCNSYRYFIESFKHGVVYAGWTVFQPDNHAHEEFIAQILNGTSWQAIEPLLEEKERDNRGDNINRIELTIF